MGLGRVGDLGGKMREEDSVGEVGRNIFEKDRSNTHNDYFT